MREEAEITERLGEERIRQRILTGTKRYLDRLAGLSERRLAGGPASGHRPRLVGCPVKCVQGPAYGSAGTAARGSFDKRSRRCPNGAGRRVVPQDDLELADP
jgi:hypothetical protein